MLELISHDMLEPVVIQNCVIFHAFVSAKGVGLYIRSFVSNINKEGSLGNRNRPRLFLNVDLQKICDTLCIAQKGRNCYCF